MHPFSIASGLPGLGLSLVSTALLRFFCLGFQLRYAFVVPVFDRVVVLRKLVIRQEGANCTLSVDGSFRRVKGTSGPSAIALIGNGEAKLEGNKFFGTAILQTIMSDVPGIDVSAPYMPKKFGPKLDAVAEGEVIEDGVLLFEIRSTVLGEGFTLPEGRRTVA